MDARKNDSKTSVYRGWYTLVLHYSATTVT